MLLMMMARATGSTMSKTIKTRLYKRVLRRIWGKSRRPKKYLKLSKATHLLLNRLVKKFAPGVIR